MIACSGLDAAWFVLAGVIFANLFMALVRIWPEKP